MIKVNILVVSLLAVVGRIEEKLAEEGAPDIMEEKQIAAIGSFCLNEACEEYQQVNHGNMMKYGQTEKGVQRYRCKSCKKTCTDMGGTLPLFPGDVRDSMCSPPGGSGTPIPRHSATLPQITMHYECAVASTAFGLACATR